MKRSRTGSPVEEAPVVPAVVSVQVPLPLFDVLADLKTSFFGLCLTAGQQVFQAMKEQDREQLCGPKNVPDPDRRAIRGGSAPSEVVFGGRRIAMPRLRARSTDGKEIPLPTFRYARARDPLDAYTLEQIAIGVATRKYRRTLDPLPDGVAERASRKAPYRVGSSPSPAASSRRGWLRRSMVSTSASSSSMDSISGIT